MSAIAVFDCFVEKCPAAVMVRATLENLLRPERLDQIFNDAAERQYEKELLFSEVVALMSAVATRTHKSVHAAYQARSARLNVSKSALYAKLNHLEPGISSALIRETAGDAARIIDGMPERGRSCCRDSRSFTWTAIIWRPANIGSPSRGGRGKACCQASRWRCWMPSGG